MADFVAVVGERPFSTIYTIFKSTQDVGHDVVVLLQAKAILSDDARATSVRLDNASLIKFELAFPEFTCALAFVRVER